MSHKHAQALDSLTWNYFPEHSRALSFKQSTTSLCYNQFIDELLKKTNAPKFHKDGPCS